MFGAHFKVSAHLVGSALQSPSCGVLDCAWQELAAGYNERVPSFGSVKGFGLDPQLPVVGSPPLCTHRSKGP